nr:hypothetical protein [Chloroflexota bacterium]
MTSLPPLKPKRGFNPAQVRLLAVVWVALTVVVGVCTFGAIFWAAGGFAQPTPTAAPTATPAPTFTPLPQPTAAPTVAGKAPLPPLTNFMLGGQAIHGGIPHTDQMKQAGMTWVKLQAQDLTVDFGPAIDNAHRLGLRILISVVDKTDEKYKIATPEYQQKLADYLVTLARQGVDAIEVWNEANIDREWPTGQIGGANYTDLLKFVYPQIKAANPDTMVISGAMAPTGYFGGGCTPQGCDDKPFLEQMAAAGAFNYADCIGIHYNEGILPPTQTTGDPRGNSEHYTRYYQSMVDTYVAATGNVKPLCFTELGYLTGEGYPSLAAAAPNFAWANDTTIAQQAEWLAEAARLSRDQGKVRLLIVFNVDFTTYDADPQAGYALLRADGTCPACDTLGAVMATP